LIEADLTDLIGAAPHERSAERTNLHNGHRTRASTTPAGDLELRIPTLRTGSFFPSLSERRRRVDQALFAVICADLGQEVGAFRDRSLSGQHFPYVSSTPPTARETV
jgi:putative transposase